MACGKGKRKTSDRSKDLDPVENNKRLRTDEPTGKSPSVARTTRSTGKIYCSSE